MLIVLVCLGVAWLLAVVLIWAFIAGASRPLSREETERLREAAHAALRQSERRNVHVILKPSDDVPSHLVGRN